MTSLRKINNSKKNKIKNNKKILEQDKSLEQESEELDELDELEQELKRIRNNKQKEIQIQEELILNYQTRVGIVGYRYYNNYERVKEELDKFNSECKIDLIVSGGCIGVDTLGERWADENNIPKIIFHPNINLGASRFRIRDQKIVDVSSHLIAFPSNKGKGTQMTMRMADKKGIDKKVFFVD